MLILPSVHKSEWAPSQHSAGKTKFRIRARCRHDGAIRWVGWFEDRDDFDAFLYAIAAGELHYDPGLWKLPTPYWDLWRLPNPTWHPDLNEDMFYDFATVTFLTSTPGSNLAYAKPSDWSDAANTIETIGGGGSGGRLRRGSGSNGTASGGGGGAYNHISNLALTGTATYQIGSGGAGAATSSGNAVTVAGNVGGDTWFNGTTLALSSCGSKGGQGGVANLTAIVSNGGPGGMGASGVGSGFSGGRGGNTGASNADSTGGGGAAGPNGAGNNGSDTLVDNESAGGSADAGSGGAGGAVAGASTAGSVGANGTEWDGTHGSGGGGGSSNNTASATGGAGGNYGGGGAAATGAQTGTATSGAGKQGMIVVTYTAGIAATTILFGCPGFLSA